MVAEGLERVAARLRDECDALQLGPPVAVSYNPLRYAWEPHRGYLGLADQPQAILLGMNPGPFGMMQTGVPFGEIGSVRDWLGLGGRVEQPAQLHPKRPVQGFACTRSEVSGRRVWGWAQSRYASREAFFRQLFPWNYCPLALFDAEGRNVTPDKLRQADRKALFPVCDRALAAVVEVLRPRVVIGVGRFAEQRAAEALRGTGVEIGGVTHPSPANPLANKDWAGQMDAAMARYGLDRT